LDIGTYSNGKVHLTLAAVGEQIVSMFGQMVNVPIWDIKRGYSVRPTKAEVQPKQKTHASTATAADADAASSVADAGATDAGADVNGGMAIKTIRLHLLGFGIDDPPKVKKDAAAALVQKIEQQPPVIYNFARAGIRPAAPEGRRASCQAPME
jgi:hypothetical protein